MTEPTQIILIAVILVLTVLLALLGIQLVKILQEFKKTMEKINKILDDAGLISQSIAQPATSLAGIVGGVESLLKFLGAFLKHRQNEEKAEPEEKQIPQDQDSLKKRFFRNLPRIR